MSTSEHDSDDAPTIGTFPFPAPDVFQPNYNQQIQLNPILPSTNMNSQLFSTMLSTPTTSIDPCMDIAMSPMNYNINHYNDDEFFIDHHSFNANILEDDYRSLFALQSSSPNISISASDNITMNITSASLPTNTTTTAIPPPTSTSMQTNISLNKTLPPTSNVFNINPFSCDLPMANNPLFTNSYFPPQTSLPSAIDDDLIMDLTPITDKPVVFQEIKSNIYVSHDLRRKNKREMNETDMKADEEMDVGICDCDPQKGEQCTDRCVNRMLFYECTPLNCRIDAEYASNRRCLNRRIQSKKWHKLQVLKAGRKGWGLFANEFIPVGDLVIEYCGEVINKKESQQRLREKYCGSKKFFILSVTNNMFIDATIKGCNARFINHSCEPNCISQKWNIGNEICMAVFANQNIRAGDEITFDYKYLRYGDQPRHPCYCGSKNCRKYIGAKTLASLNRKMKRKKTKYSGIIVGKEMNDDIQYAQHMSQYLSIMEDMEHGIPLDLKHAIDIESHASQINTACDSQHYKYLQRFVPVGRHIKRTFANESRNTLNVDIMQNTENKKYICYKNVPSDYRIPCAQAIFEYECFIMDQAMNGRDMDVNKDLGEKCCKSIAYALQMPSKNSKFCELFDSHSHVFSCLQELPLKIKTETSEITADETFVEIPVKSKKSRKKRHKKHRKNKKRNKKRRKSISEIMCDNTTNDAIIAQQLHEDLNRPYLRRSKRSSAATTVNYKPPVVVNLCPYCGLSQFDIVGDDDYQWKIHLNSEHTYHCTLCKYLFVNEHDLDLHAHQTHSSKSKVQSVAYFTEDDIIHAEYIQRTLNASLNKYLPIMCLQCHRVCNVKTTSWKAHLHANHIYRCKRVKCSLVFAHAKKLKEHLNVEVSECFDIKRHQRILWFIENGVYIESDDSLMITDESSFYSSSDYHRKRHKKKKSKYVISSEDEDEMKVVSEDSDSDLNMILNKNVIKIECKEESEKVMINSTDEQILGSRMCGLNIKNLKLILKNMSEQKISIAMQNTMLSAVSSINPLFDPCETKERLSLCPIPSMNTNVINAHVHCSDDEQSLNSCNIIIDNKTNDTPPMDHLSQHQKQLLQNLPSIADINHSKPTTIEVKKDDEIKVDVGTPSASVSSAVSSSSNSNTDSDGSISENSTSYERQFPFKNRMIPDKEYLHHRRSMKAHHAHHSHSRNPRGRRKTYDRFKRYQKYKHRYYGRTIDSPSRSRSRNKYHQYNYHQPRLPMYSQHMYHPQISPYPQFTSPPSTKYSQQPSITALPVVYQYTHEHPQSGGQYFHTTTNNMFFQNPNLSPHQMHANHHSSQMQSMQNVIPYHHRFHRSNSGSKRIVIPTKMFMRNVPHSVTEDVLRREVFDMGVRVKCLTTFVNSLLHTGDRIKFANFEFYSIKDAIYIKQQFGGGQNIEYRFTKLLENPVIGLISVQDFIENHKFLHSLHH